METIEANETGGFGIDVVRGNLNNRVIKWSYVCTTCDPSRTMSMVTPTNKSQARDAAVAHLQAHMDGTIPVSA